MTRMAWAAVGLVLLVSTTFGMLAALETYRGRVALATAQTAEAHGEYSEAIAAARVAIEAHVPYTDHAEHASTLLERLAARAKESRDSTTAALALRVGRQAAEAIGNDARAAELRARERDLAGPAPVEQPREPRATGVGRGPIGLGSQLTCALGIALLGAALVCTLRRPALPRRLCFALSALGTVVLAASRFLA